MTLLRSFDELIEAFDNKILPKSEWTHEAHLAVAFAYVFRFDQDEDMAALRPGIISYNEATNTANTDTDGYHETITWFWLQIVREYCLHKAGNADELFSSFMKTELSSQETIFRYYSQMHLFTVEARRLIVAPDLEPLNTQTQNQ